MFISWNIIKNKVFFVTKISQISKLKNVMKGVIVMDFYCS